MREFDWIATHFAPLATTQAALNLQDDTALLSIPSDQQLVISTDALHEAVHFLPDTSPLLLAQKALAVNLSDLAAMGAAPLGYTLALSLPRATDEAWIAAFASGLAIMQQRYGLSLLGGDTTATQGTLSVCITIFGTCPIGSALQRNGAQAGDGVYITGSIGNGLIGLMAARRQIDHPLRAHYECPPPRTHVGIALRGVASACMDISDGLLQDMQHICHASHVGAQITLDLVPVHSEAPCWMSAHGLSMTDLACGGDDYELLFTAADDKVVHISDLAATHALPITRIGTITQERDYIITDSHGQKIAPQVLGFQHF